MQYRLGQSSQVGKHFVAGAQEFEIHRCHIRYSFHAE
jgi:hypothetical protein